MSAKSSKYTQRKTGDEIATRTAQGENVPAPRATQHVSRQRVNIDFPLHLLRQIDAECQHAGVTRQAWIKMVCAERLQQRQSAQTSSVESALPAMEGSRSR